MEAKGAFKKQLRAEHDFADKGRIKAESRAQERHSCLKGLGEVVGKLALAAEQCCQALNEEHSARSALKADLGTEVLDLIDLKIDKLEEQVAVDEETEEPD